MKLVKLHSGLGFVSSLLVVLAVSACSDGSLETQAGGGASSLNAFNVSGNAQQVSLAEFKAKKVGSVLASPESCRAFVKQSMTVGLWAGYTDDENKWGKARANCSVKDGGTYCTQDNEVYFEANASNMGMEIPKVFELGSTVQYLCLSAARAVGLASGAPRSKAMSSDQVSIEHVSNLKATIANRDRSINDVYVITVKNTNSKTNRSLEKKYFFGADGMPIGVRNSQEQNFNEVVQKQTAELHFLYPNTQSVLNEPRL